MGAVRIQEGPGDIDDLLSSPEEHKPGAFRHHGHRGSLQVLLRRVGQEGFLVLLVHNHSHALLGLGDGDLRAVQTGVFLRNQVEIHPQACRQLADGHRHAARAEIVALLDETCHLRTAEQPLDLALRGRVSFLDLRAAGLDGRLRVDLGGSGGAAAAVPARSAAQQNDQIARIRGLPDYVLPGSRAHHRADLHALRHVGRMIDFFYIAGGQADLVAVGAVALGRSPHQLLLGQLALQGLLYRDGGVCRARYAHGLVHVGSSRQRVADGSAQAGGGASEGLDLGRVIVRLVFKIHQPLLGLPVDLHGHHDGAGVNLVRLLLILQLSFRFQLAHGHQGQIHQADELVLPALKNLRPIRQILLIGLLDRLPVIALRKAYVRKLRGEGRVAAVIGPVGVQHPDLRHGRIPLLLIPEIILDVQEILEGHGQVQRSVQLL